MTPDRARAVTLRAVLTPGPVSAPDRPASAFSGATRASRTASGSRCRPRGAEAFGPASAFGCAWVPGSYGALGGALPAVGTVTGRRSGGCVPALAPARALRCARAAAVVLVVDRSASEVLLVPVHARIPVLGPALPHGRILPHGRVPGCARPAPRGGARPGAGAVPRAGAPPHCRALLIRHASMVSGAAAQRQAGRPWQNPEICPDSRRGKCSTAEFEDQGSLGARP
jgi:hypothetical protein